MDEFQSEALTEGHRWEVPGLSGMLDTEVHFRGIGDVLQDDDGNECAHEDGGDPEHVRPEETLQQAARSSHPAELVRRRMREPLLDHLQCSDSLRAHCAMPTCFSPSSIKLRLKSIAHRPANIVF